MMKHMLGHTEQENLRSHVMEKGSGAAQKTGSLQMTCTADGRTFRIGVVLTVYGGSSSFDHYAILSHEGKISGHAGFINLRQCTVERVDNDGCSFNVIQKDCDGNVLTFTAKTPELTNSWLVALSSGSSDSRKRSPFKSLSLSNCQMAARIPRDLCMPTLCEEGE